MKSKLIQTKVEDVNKSEQTCRYKHYFIYFAVYTVLFALVALAVFFPFLKEGKSFIWIPDGLQQHFNSLVYYREWLRTIAHNLFVEHQFRVPLWDMSIGYGSDIITTLHYYVVGDPLNLLSVFVPKRQWMDEFYNALVIVRLYLAGTAFSMYCFSHGKDRFPVLLGALLYTFCSWAIVGIRHPYFINPMIYIPLIFMGVDRILKKKKPGLYMAVLAVSVISNFYFAYMICMFILIYTIFAYLHLVRKRDVSEFRAEHSEEEVFGKKRKRQSLSAGIKLRQFQDAPVLVMRFLVYSITSMAIASTILIPVVAMTLNTGRSKANNYIESIYPLQYYLKLIPGFLMGGAGYWSYMGYTAFGVLGIMLLFLLKKQNRAFKAAFLLLSIFLLIPFAGHMLNGFSYVINRYMWCYSFLVAYIFVKLYPELYELKDKQKLQLFFAGVTYLLCCVVIGIIVKKKEILYSAFPLLLLIEVLLIANRSWKNGKKRIAIQCMLLAILCGSLGYQGFVTNAGSQGNYVSEFADQNEALDALTVDTASNVLEDISDDTVFRYDQSQAETWKNAAMQQHLNGTSYYFSLADSNINQFQREMYLIQSRDFCYSNLDGRSILDALASVKYFVVDRSREELLPFGFFQYKATKAIGEDIENRKIYSAFENDLWLPLGFTSTNYIPRSQYEKLSVTRKQQALLQGVVLEESGFESAPLTFTEEKQKYSIKEGENIILSNHTIQVEEDGASIMLELNGMRNSETYVIFEGLDYRESTTGSNLKRETDRVKIRVSEGRMSKNITYLTSKNNFYSDIHDFLLNTGYRIGSVSSIQLTFEKKGIYTYDDLSIVCQPMTEITEQAERLQEEHLENVTIGTNEVSGHIAVSESKILCISLPYSTGWTAYVDGVETELKRADTMYMALELEEGSHEIVLTYFTPYLKLGLVVSALGLIGFVLILLWHGKRRKPERNSEMRDE